MKFLVTGSAGHLGEALVRTLCEMNHEVVGLDILESPYTTEVGSISERSTAMRCMSGVEVVLHAATLHKPHVGTHSRQEFVDTNVTGTLNLLEAAVSEGVKSFVYTSTTSVFGDALMPAAGAPAAWITEEVTPVPKNIYGVTKAAAEDLCQLFHRNHRLPCIVLRTSRFFPEEDDNEKVRKVFSDENVKANEYLYRRVDIEDVVSAHVRAAEHARDLRFRKYIVSATTPFRRGDLERLRNDAPTVVRERGPDGYEPVYGQRGWKMFSGIDRVYVNERARNELGWNPRYDFSSVVGCLTRGVAFGSALSRAVGSKGYHDEVFSHGPTPWNRGLKIFHRRCVFVGPPRTVGYVSVKYRVQ